MSFLRTTIIANQFPMLFNLLNKNLTVFPSNSGFISERTNLICVPEEQALPPLHITPAMSKLNNSISELFDLGKFERTVFKLLSDSSDNPLNEIPENSFFNFRPYTLLNYKYI